jgi:hypothetical protein
MGQRFREMTNRATYLPQKAHHVYAKILGITFGNRGPASAVKQRVTFVNYYLSKRKLEY